MVIGFLAMEIFLPYSQSLKDKRRVLNTLRDRVRGRFNAAFAELDFQDKWQRSRIGIVTLNSQKGLVDEVLQKICRDVEENLEGEIILSEFHYF
ncbi:MAG: hypothetical protein A2028_04445 [Candidatus Aminicenantes bacterium RBG_19FT_COMBO_59_29]|nr:MAG: hypothetical protein A2028_04445 [Candidatus Aminicenantes bacterium RBG_19FT_COMBO_59_29]